MNISDRILNLRKAKGLSQEELADKIGVSRQAVSKWESEQSVPDIDKVILLSEFFEVTTDYLLKGIENEKQTGKKQSNANIYCIISTVLNFIGLIISCAVWYEKQVAAALVIGLVFMALGCMVFGAGLYDAEPSTKAPAKRNFWSLNIWILTFIPLSFVYNLLFAGSTAPYPLFVQPVLLYALFWLIYLAVGLAVVLMQQKGLFSQK